MIILTDFNKDRAKEMPIKDNIRIDSRFSLKYLLGSGGMGRVYLATDSENGNDVAIKFLSADNQNANKRFSREIETLSEINHKSVVQYICSGSTDDGYWYAMDHIPGPNITDWFRSKGILDYPLLSETMSHIASALSVVHEKGVVHRDVKPDNILMNGDLPVLVDFGIVHLQSSTQSTKLTHEGSIVGTAMYMSPEQVMGGIIDGRSDLYSLGTILYEILTSCHPFPAENFPRLVSKILRERPIRPTAHNPGIPKALEQITVRLLEKNPDLRYDSAEQLVESLNRFIHGGEVSKSENQSPMKAYETKTIPFVGRTDQLEKLKTLFDSATIGNGGLAVITGESGLGKSRLLSEYKMMVLGGFGRFLECQKAGDSSVRPAISSVLNQLADYEIAYNPDFIKKHSHMIRSLSPKFANAIGIVSNPPNISDDDMIPKVIAQILCESFPEIPVVIAFEDRLDNITEKIIHECARKSIDSKVIVCCQSEADIPEFLNGIKRVSHIELQPFDVDDINQLAKSIIGRDLTTGEGEKIIKTSGGKPGIAIHLISSLKPFDETISLTSVPEYSHLLNQRVDELSNSAREIISTLSLFDKPIPLSILKPISRLTSTNFQKAFDSLESGNMIQVSNKGFELFCNIISKDVRDFVYNSLTEERFRELNQLIASTLSIYYSNSDDPGGLVQFTQTNIFEHLFLCGAGYGSDKASDTSKTQWWTAIAIGLGFALLGVAVTFATGGIGTVATITSITASAVAGASTSISAVAFNELLQSVIKKSGASKTMLIDESGSMMEVIELNGFTGDLSDPEQAMAAHSLYKSILMRQNPAGQNTKFGHIMFASREYIGVVSPIKSPAAIDDIVSAIAQGIQFDTARDYSPITGEQVGTWGKSNGLKYFYFGLPAVKYPNPYKDKYWDKDDPVIGAHSAGGGGFGNGGSSVSSGSAVRSGVQGMPSLPEAIQSYAVPGANTGL